MKMINIIWACIVICFGGVVPCSAQQNAKDQVLLERLARVYNIMPRDLKAEEWLKKIDEVDRLVNGLILFRGKR